MINVLFIALEFPPIQAAGAVRALRFARLLPGHGIRPIVVSFSPVQFTASAIHKVSPAFAREVPAETPIYFLDVSAIEPDKTPLAPGVHSPFRGTHCATVEKLFERVAADFDIDMIWATCPPFNVGPIAIAAKEHFRRPLLLDMRDAWSQWGSTPLRTWFHYRAILARERAMLDAADKIACVTPQLVEMELGLTRKPRQAFHWIPNAYDQESLPHGEISLAPGKQTCRIAYTGQFYYNQLHETADGIIPWFRKMPHRWLHYHPTRQRWIYRTPYFFFRAWKAFRDTYPDLAQRFEFHYVGNTPDWLPAMADSFGLTGQCTWHGFKSREETAAILDECDAMLSTSIKVENGEDYCLASKTFDYILARKPVLGFVCPGSQRNFLIGANIAALFDPDDPQRCASQLRSLIENGFCKEVDHAYLERFSSRATTKQLADLIKATVAERLRDSVTTSAVS
jgi:glycosyltransferase involved in cell wall biosynthesis